MPVIQRFFGVVGNIEDFCGLFANSVLCAKKKGSSALKPIDNSGELFVVGVVILFSWEEAS